MIPYASTHGRRYRRRRFIPGAGTPRFTFSAASGIGVKGLIHHSRAGVALADTRVLRMWAVAQRLRPLPPMFGERRWSIPRRWRSA